MRPRCLSQKSLVRLACLATLSAAALSSAAHAQTAPEDQATTLDEVVVTGTSVQATVRTAPASVSVIGNEQLSARPAADINDIIGRLPGVTKAVTTDGGTSIQIRGLPQAYTLVLVDGQRMGSSSDTFDRYTRNELNWVPPEAIERVEVVRGPMSSLYGSDAMGGVINIITKATEEYWRGALTATTVQPEESIRGADYVYSGYVSGPITDSLAVRLTGSVSEQQADRGLPDGTTSFRFGGGREGSRVRSGGARVTWKPIEGHQFAFTYDASLWEFFPGPAPTTSNPGGVSASTRGPSRMERSSPGATYTGDFSFGVVRLSAYQTRYENATTAPIITNGVPVAGSSRDAKAISEDLVLNASLSTRFNLLFDHALTVGAQYIDASLDNPNSVGNQANAQGVAGLSSKSTESFAVFGEDQIALTDQLKLTLGVRLDDHSDFGNHVSPRAYLVYQPVDAVTIKGGYSAGFRAPTLRQSNPNFISVSAGAGCSASTMPGYVGGGCYTLGSEGLQPETTENWEVGATWARGEWSAGATVFTTKFEDKIDINPIGYLTGFTQYWNVYTNITEAKTEGLELTGTAPILRNVGHLLLDSLTLTANATHMFTSENTHTGAPLSTIPEWAANTTLDWTVSEQLNLALDVQYTGKMVGLDFVRQANAIGTAQIQKAFTLVDLSANVRVNDSVTVNTGIRNLFDESPNGLADGGNNFYTPGRRVFVSLTGRF